MTKRIFRYVFSVSLAMFLATVVMVMSVQYGYFSDAQHRKIKSQTTLAADGVNKGGTDYLKKLGKVDCRITLISADGKVLFDTQKDAASMENHLNRTEVKQALKKGYGESSRYSTTLMEKQVYCAQKLDDGSIVRVSDAQITVLSMLVSAGQPIAFLLLAAIIVSCILAYSISKRIVKPLNDLDLNNVNPNKNYPEISPLLSKLEHQQRQLKKQEKELEKRKSEFETVTDNMNEGLILLNNDGELLSVNKTAAKITRVFADNVGRNILDICHLKALRNAVESLKHSSEPYSERFIVLDREYCLNSSPVVVGGKVYGNVIFIVDMTEKEKTERMRREFTANVSHELKTPLQSISGCAELLSGGLVKAEDTAEFSNRIYRESQRMIRLIDDIIRLSHLDEGVSDMQFEDLNLYDIAQKTVDNLRPVAEKEQIKISLDGESAVIKGIPQLIAVTVYNLCDNAVKYNKKGGDVNVSVKSDADTASITVSDTGIGIPEEYKDRIFERFFRVDKSHSKEVGGTGLGLSIVKHAAKLHNADISLKSEEGKGTSVTLTFPANR